MAGDMASKIISTEVKDFLKSDQCLKKSLAGIFGFDWQWLFQQP